MTTRTQSGFATAEFLVGVAVLILPMVILVALVPRWSEAQLAAKTAANAGAQAAVLTLATTDSEEQAQTRGRQASAAVLATYGVPGRIEVVTDGEAVIVTVTVGLPVFPVLPGSHDTPARGGEIPEDQVSGFTTTARAVRLVDPFRAPVVNS